MGSNSINILNNNNMIIIHDEHLNVFWNYSGSPKLENNITKAMINSLQSLCNKDKLAVINKLLEMELNFSEVDFEFYLQRKPNESLIKSIDEDNRKLLAFSPTGKAWGYGGIDINNAAEIKKTIEQSLINSGFIDDDLKNEVNSEIKRVMAIVEGKGESIPDGWIIIYSRSIPVYCIALENKLYDLNPYQLRNHCKKSLFLEDLNMKKAISYRSYEEIINFMGMFNTNLIINFIQYMYILGYVKVKDLSEIPILPNKATEKKYIIERCKELLSEMGINGEIGYHKGWCWYLAIGNDLHKKVGIDYDSEKEEIIVKMYFATTQSLAKELYKKNIDKHRLLNINSHNSFHFQFIGIGKNVPWSYCNNKKITEKHIDFWQLHYNDLKQMGKAERKELLKKMYENELFSLGDFNRLIEKSNRYENKLNVCPEIGVLFKWSLNEAKELDKISKLALDMKAKIEEVYKIFNMAIK